MRRVVADRLGVVPDEIAAGHGVALSRPKELASLLASYLPWELVAHEKAGERPVLTVAQVSERVDRRPVGNIRKLPADGYRLR
jgi:hypothetical protein